MSEIGPIINGRHVEQAVLDTLEGFLPVYLADRAADNDLPRSTYKVASYARSATVDTRFPNDYLPCVVVRAVGKSTRGMEGSGDIPASFNVMVGVLLADQNRDSSADAAWDYISAIEAVLIQQGALGGFAEATVPGDTDLVDLDIDKQRTLAGAQIEVEVIVKTALNAFGGPIEPPDDPTDPLPTDPQVESVDVDVEPQ